MHYILIKSKTPGCMEFYENVNLLKRVFSCSDKLLKISLFIGPKRPRGKSSNCHINWLARAGRSILVTKFRADVLVPLSHSAAHNRVLTLVVIFL